VIFQSVIAGALFIHIADFLALILIPLVINVFKNHTSAGQQGEGDKGEHYSAAHEQAPVRFKTIPILTA